MIEPLADPITIVLSAVALSYAAVKVVNKVLDMKSNKEKTIIKTSSTCSLHPGIETSVQLVKGCLDNLEKKMDSNHKEITNKLDKAMGDLYRRIDKDSRDYNFKIGKIMGKLGINNDG